MEILKEALIDSAKLMPVLFLAYLVIELIEYKYALKLRQRLQRANKFASVWGAILGVFPQCGFSSLASALFANKLIGYGAIAAVFISTSDEAVPILLANAKNANIIAPLILIKVVLAVICGLLIDFFIKRKVISQNLNCNKEDCNKDSHHHDIILNETGCRPHEIAEAKPKPKDILLHPIEHTVRIAIYIFIISAAIGYIFYLVPESSVKSFLDNKGFLQIIFAAIFGLVPNCVASVTITNFYLSGILNFSAMLSGLITSAGVGYLVLFKENKNLKENLTVILIVLISAVVAGIVSSFFAL